MHISLFLYILLYYSFVIGSGTSRWNPSESFHDSSISIAKIAIKILQNKRYRKKLGKEARNSMKKYKNNLLLEKWI